MKVAQDKTRLINISNGLFHNMTELNKYKRTGEQPNYKTGRVKITWMDQVIK